MEASALALLIAAGEGPQVAFARSKARRDEIAESLVAFANGHGGSLILGLAGRTRAKVEGVADLAAARDLLIDAALVCTPPLVLPLPHEVTLNGVVLLVLHVPAGLSQVYALHGKYLRREGASNQPLAPDALRRLLLERGEVSWERSVPAGVSLAELDQAKIAAYAQRVGPAAAEEPMALLYARGCLTRAAAPTGAALPTNAGMLLFARQIEARYPQAEVTLVRYRGRDMADIFEREDVRATLPEAVRRAERWLAEHMRKGSRMDGLERQDWTQFPPGAVREALVNAVAHRDYSVRGEGIRVALFSDRLEVYSPGRLPGHVTLQNIVEERYSRNESLVQVLADYGMIERLGYGIDRMLRQMEAAGLPPPEFRETAAGFLVTLTGQPVDDLTPAGLDTREWVRMGLNERQIAAMVQLAREHRITNRDLQERYPDVSAESVRRDLADLVERGLLLKVGDKRATYYILK
ncbi:ATP-binding protein [Candidatus Viridilinea mediisalina]|uniref:Transcriptional regulator n=1 Tax=Candidatus Viridilinea mediisalina TaxID=2024553 RepID=A0A2A6RIK3_9CHLR|nr:ATP-binding protein [Candidatus Viridilinea mediisalina]PDW02726.1 transcriptional regulator [Candidatus Viridilinea mediisalina]